jgi:hypothetical protein
MSGVEVGEDYLFINYFLEIHKEISLNIPIRFFIGCPHIVTG